MTTYEFKSGLRLALMKLENSLSSHAGLRLNRIGDLRHPEERMAARLIERLGAVPPVDVQKVCESLADLSFKRFPFEIDGICLDLKQKGKRPKVWVSKQLPRVRQRFTLAHEIGHIVIPWHTGTIVDDIEAPRSKEASRYREMEAEANRFAVELLMPTTWVAGLAERCEDAAGLMRSINQIAEVSFPAAFLKTAKLGRPGFVGAEVRDGLIVRSIRTPETNSRPPDYGASIDSVVMPAAHDPTVVNGGDSSYFWWKIKEAIEDPGAILPSWRDILNDILLTVPPEDRSRIRASVNAIVGLGIGREPRGSAVGKIYRRGIESIQNRSSEDYWLNVVMEDERLPSYILARSRERAQ